MEFTTIPSIFNTLYTMTTETQHQARIMYHNWTDFNHWFTKHVLTLYKLYFTGIFSC